MASLPGPQSLPSPLEPEAAAADHYNITNNHTNSTPSADSIKEAPASQEPHKPETSAEQEPFTAEPAGQEPDTADASAEDTDIYAQETAQQTARPRHAGIVLRPYRPEDEKENEAWYSAAQEKGRKALKWYRRKLVAVISLAVIAFVCILCAAIGAAMDIFSASADTIGSSSTVKYRLDLGLTMQVSSVSVYDYEVYLYGPAGASASGYSYLESGATLCFAPTTLEIIIPAGQYVTQYAYVNVYGRIYDFSLTGPVSVSSSSVNNGSGSTETSVKYTFSGLTDGQYTIQFTKDEYYINSTSLGGTSEGYKGEATAKFVFSVDTTAPVITGASLGESTPLYVNSDFTVSVSDATSGAYQLGYQTPKGSTFTWGTIMSRSFTISSSGEGLYKFAAKDNAGNSSDYYYTYADCTAPTITAKGADLNDVTDGTFTITASDASGTQTLYYRKSDSVNWITAAGTSVTISSTDGDGEYEFYAADAAGNTSEKYYVTLDTAEIEGFFITSDTDNSQCFYWNNSNWTATLDGSPYEKNTWISDEGDHEITLTSRYGDTLEYSCTIDHYYNAVSTVDATCAAEGYTVYECVHCGDTYEADFVASLKHDYRAVYTSPTCTAQGFMTYTCADCGYSYTDGYTAATGHYYTKTTIAPTCDAEGYCLYECIVCGDTYTTDYTDETEHEYVCTYTAPTCTMPGLYTYTCTICGDSYVEEVGYPTDHTYAISVIKSATCEEDGERYYECTVCGYNYYMVVPATGHTYIIESQYTQDGDVMRVYICADCGEEYTEDLGNQTEYVVSFIDGLFDSYSSYMWWILLAVAGVWSVVMGVMYIRARKAEDKDKARRMLVNYLLGLVIIAAVIVAAPYLAYGIASLVT